MAVKTKSTQADAVINRLVADQKETTDWRGEVTVILTKQTEILSALREDFKKYEEQEERYQAMVTKFMSETSTAQALLNQKGTDQEKVIQKQAENHNEVMNLVRGINNKVWLVTGAVMIYAPIISYMAIKLFEHLTTTTVTIGH